MQSPCSKSPQNAALTGLFPLAIALGLFAWLVACGPATQKTKTTGPFLTIQNGRFEVTSVYLTTDVVPSGQAMGSGNLSFDFSGDTSGTFIASGPLVSNQTQNIGVGAFIVRIWDEDYSIFREGMSVLGFYPKSNGKADVFVLGTKTDVLLDSIKAGNIYGIGPNNRFNGLYLKGINISDFWQGEKNFIEAADQAFIIQEGLIGIDARDSTHVAGIFSGTTHITVSSRPEIFLLH